MASEIKVQARLYAVKEPRWIGDGRMVSVRAKGPGSKNKDGTWSALWLDVLAKDGLADQLAQVQLKSEFEVWGEIKAGADWTDKDGQVRQGGTVLWADSFPAFDGVPSVEQTTQPADDVDFVPF
jgi:hypothetical protein